MIATTFVKISQALNLNTEENKYGYKKSAASISSLEDEKKNITIDVIFKDLTYFLTTTTLQSFRWRGLNQRSACETGGGRQLSVPGLLIGFWIFDFQLV